MREDMLKDRLEGKAHCSTVIIGKDASVTGKVIIGHNEDDCEPIVQLHVVPRVKHEEGETIKFDDGSAVIPQVPETYSYYWSEVRGQPGESFADSFVNEWGLAIVTNRSMPSKLNGKEGDEGIGYALRRLVAERAKNAREAVQVAAELVEKYGYWSGRNYHFADKDEAWSFQVPTGHNYVARRIGDDEIYYMPNWHTIHEVDFSDTEHKKFFWSDNLVPNAIESGWYTPKTEGDWSDFDFALAYQDGEMELYNKNRARAAWRILKGVELTDDCMKPFSMKADRKYSARDIKKVLRSHSEGSADDLTDGYNKEPHSGPTLLYTICNSWTCDSSIIEFNEDVLLTRMLHAQSQPCVSPYTPWYPCALTRIPEGFNWMGVNASQRSHFCVDDADLAYDPNKVWWSVKTMQFLTQFDYKGTHKTVQSDIAALEAAWEAEKIAVESAYKELAKVDIAAAKEYLTNYTCAEAERIKPWAQKMTQKLVREKAERNAWK